MLPSMQARIIHRLPNPNLHRLPIQQLRHSRLRSGLEPSSTSGTKSNKKSALPYDYDDDELQQLAELMPPPLEATPLPSSKPETQRVLKKHGLRTDALFEVDMIQKLLEDEPRPKTRLNDSEKTEWDKLKEIFFEDEKTLLKEKETLFKKGELQKYMNHGRRILAYGMEATKEYESHQVFEKGLRVHHAQRARAKNIYAETMWYSKKLERAEIEDSQEATDENPVPSYIRAFFTLDEVFDELNANQHIADQKYHDRSLKMEEEEFVDFLQHDVMRIISEPGSEYYDVFNPIDDTEKEEKPEIDIDEYIHGILPNASTDIGLQKQLPPNPDAHTVDLIFRGDDMDF